MSRNFSYKTIQLPQLRSLALVAAHNSFSAAAKILGQSVPTIWEQVRALERKLGTTLVRRRGRVVEITPEGHLLLELVQPHLTGLDSIERLFELRRVDLQQRVRIVSTAWLLGYHLPKAVQEFAAVHPAVRLNLRAAPAWSEVPRQVERGQADMGVVPYDRDEERSTNLDYRDLFDVQLTLLASAQHPLLRKKHVTPFDLIKYPLILGGPETYAHRAMDRILRRHDLTEQAHVVLESNQLDVIRQYVASGIGIALLYLDSGGTPSWPGVGLHVFGLPEEDLPVALITRKGAVLPPVVEEFRQTICRFLGPPR